MLGVFLLLAFTHLGHERQDIFSPCDGTHMCTDLTSVYTLIRKSFGGMESEPMLILKSLIYAISQGAQSTATNVGEGQWCLFCMLVGCLTSQQHASVSQGRFCSDNLTCCHTEIEVADPTFHLTQSQYTDTGPTSPSADPITPGAWQGSRWSANHWYDSTRKYLDTSGI